LKTLDIEAFLSLAGNELGVVEDVVVVEAAAALLGASVKEVQCVEITADGPLISVKASPPYLVVPPEKPDGEGKTGLMLAYGSIGNTGFPVYRPHLDVVALVTIDSAPPRTVLDLDAREVDLQDRHDRIVGALRWTTDSSILAVLERGKGSVERERHALANLRPHLLETERAARRAAEEQAQRAAQGAVDDCLKKVTPLLVAILGLADQIDLLRAAALAAGAPDRLGWAGDPLNRASWRLGPTGRVSIPVLDRLDSLSAYLRDVWPAIQPETAPREVTPPAAQRLGRRNKGRR